MCGIAGFVDSLNRSSYIKKKISLMLDHLHKRGPDEKGTFFHNNFTFGIARLNIIDLVTGSQPVYSEDKNLVVVLNGEIYNFPHLRTELIEKKHKFYTNSDTEVLVHMYEEYGKEMLPRLNGMFSFAIYDKKKKELFIARDRIGIKPLYYYFDRKNFAFASEVKSLLELDFISKRLEPKALANYLLMEYVPAPLSIFKNIHKLLPGHFLVFKKDQLIIKKYWEVPNKNKKYSNFREVKEHFTGLLDDAVKIRLISDVPLGVFLSGGIDSSTLSLFAQRHLGNRLKTFSIGFDDPSFDESEYIKIITDKFNIDHSHKMFTIDKMLQLIPSVFKYLDEPFGDASILPTFMLSNFARKKITVALGGDGGDELLAGYPTYPAHKFALIYSRLPEIIRKAISRQVNNLPVSLKNFSFDFKAKKFVSGIDYPPVLRNFIWLGSFNEKEIPGLLSEDVMKDLKDYNLFDIVYQTLKEWKGDDVLEQILYLDLKLYLQNDILVKVDRASMANSLEVRVPLLDHRIVEFVYSLPLKYKLNFFQTKYLLKKSMKPYLPSKIINRPKKGFGIPVGKWIKSELKDLTFKLFNEKKIRNDNIFDYTIIHKLLKQHLEGRKDNRKQLWTLMAFQMWHDNYLK